MLTGLGMMGMCAMGMPPLVNLMPNSDFADGATGWTNNNPDALSFIVGKALVDDQYGDQSVNSRLFYRSISDLPPGGYRTRVEIVDYVRGGFEPRSGLDPLGDGAKLGAGIFHGILFGHDGQSPREFAIGVMGNSKFSVKRFELYKVR